jgi:hypothetical protein
MECGSRAVSERNPKIESVLIGFFINSHDPVILDGNENG